MARKKNMPRRWLSVTSVEHVSLARLTSTPSSLLPQTQERPPGAGTPLISSSSPSSRLQERHPRNPFLDLLALSSAVESQCGPQQATQPPTKQSPAVSPPPDAAPVERPDGSNSSSQCASFAGLAAAGQGEEDAVKILERYSMPLQHSTIKKTQRMAKKGRERAAPLGEPGVEVSKNMRSIEEIFWAVNECVGENCGSTESDDGSSCGGEVIGGTGGDGDDGGNGGDRCDHVAWVMRAWIWLVAPWFIFGVLVAWVVRSRFPV